MNVVRLRRWRTRLIGVSGPVNDRVLSGVRERAGWVLMEHPAYRRARCVRVIRDLLAQEFEHI